MAGEFAVAREAIAQALQTAENDGGMSGDVMASALLQTLLAHMIQNRTRRDLASLIEFQLESCGEDEFVITRGC